MKTLQMGPMNTLKRRVARFGLGISLASMLALSAVMPALASTGTGTATLTGGVNTSAVAAFAFDDGVFAVPDVPDGYMLTGLANQFATATPEITIVDASGIEAGWSVTMKLSNSFSDGGVMSFTAAPNVTGTVIMNSVPTAVTITGPGTGDISNTTAVTIAGVAAATPGGTYKVTPTIEIAIPQDTKVATYTGTLTVDVAAAIE